MNDISTIHLVKIIPGSREETRFIEALDSVGVNRENILCRLGRLFRTEYDEYIVSDGLYKQIYKVIDSINHPYSRKKQTIL